MDFDHVVGVEAHALLAGRGVRAFEALPVGVGVSKVVALPFEEGGGGGAAAGQSADGG